MANLYDVGHRYEQMVPEYPIKEAVMRSRFVCLIPAIHCRRP
ncbi:MAG: hypothetical protein ACLRXQ_04385 [Phascolarctobacterium faecium]